jgi:hypothetical protein
MPSLRMFSEKINYLMTIKDPWEYRLIAKLKLRLVIYREAPINYDKVGQAWTKYPQFFG